VKLQDLSEGPVCTGWPQDQRLRKASRGFVAKASAEVGVFLSHESDFWRILGAEKN